MAIFKFFGGIFRKFAERSESKHKQQFRKFFGFPPRAGMHEAVRLSDVQTIIDFIRRAFKECVQAKQEYEAAKHHCFTGGITNVEELTQLEINLNESRAKLAKAILLCLKVGYIEVAQKIRLELQDEYPWENEG